MGERMKKLRSEWRGQVGVTECEWESGDGK